MTPNQVFDAYEEGKSHENLLKKKFVILGAGKTAMDCIVFLQRTMKVKPENIAWVIPNDVWMLCLTGGGNPWSWPTALLECGGDELKACLQLEEKGILCRLDKNVMPTKFRFPVITKDELILLRNIQNIIRRGRATAIRNDDNNVIVEFGDKNPAWNVFAPADKCVFVHATSPGPFNGKNVDDLFVNDHVMSINLLFAPPISSSMSSIAKIEAARRNGTLDLEFARRLYNSRTAAPETGIVPDHATSDNDILRWAIRGVKLSGDETREKLKPVVTLAMFIAILDKDPMVAINWMKGNRLTFFSIPNFKGHCYEQISLLSSTGKSLGFSDNDITVFKMLAEKLKPIEGM